MSFCLVKNSLKNGCIQILLCRYVACYVSTIKILPLDIEIEVEQDANKKMEITNCDLQKQGDFMGKRIESLLPVERITSKIYLLRNEKILIDRDLAELYGVETKRLKEAVKRNIDRFPSDFMFVLSKEELKNWRTQFATSNSDKMGLRHAPLAFTEQGVAMLSSVLNSERAVQVNIAIMRVPHLRDTDENVHAEQ